MKTTIILLTVAALATLAGGVQADDTFLSPKASQTRHESRTVAGNTPDLLDRSASATSPRAVAFAESIRKVSGTTPDLLARNAGVFSPRALVNNPALARQFEIAPLK